MQNACNRAFPVVSLIGTLGCCSDSHHAWARKAQEILEHFFENLFGLFLILGTLLGNAIDNTFGKTVGNPVVNTIGDERISGGKEQTNNKWYHAICKIGSV